MDPNSVIFGDQNFFKAFHGPFIMTARHWQQKSELPIRVRMFLMDPGSVIFGDQIFLKPFTDPQLHNNQLGTGVVEIRVTIRVRRFLMDPNSVIFGDQNFFKAFHGPFIMTARHWQQKSELPIRVRMFLMDPGSVICGDWNFLSLSQALHNNQLDTGSRNQLSTTLYVALMRDRKREKNLLYYMSKKQ